MRIVVILVCSNSLYQFPHTIQFHYLLNTGYRDWDKLDST